MDRQASQDLRALMVHPETEDRQVFQDLTDHLESGELRGHREREENLASLARWDPPALRDYKDHPDLLVNVESGESRGLLDLKDPQDWVAEWETKDLPVIPALRE